jgi:uncharacterized protein (TIGR03435 family)
MRTALLSAIIAAVGSAAFGQAPDALTFEVASVRPSPPPGPNERVFFGPPRGGPGTSDPGQITWKNAALRNILMTAYDVQTFQIDAPDWLSTSRYDIVAKIPPGTTKQQVNVMWQSLLKERFGLVLHHQSKEFRVENLVAAKGGVKLKTTELAPDAEPFAPGGEPPKRDKNGFPDLNGTGMMIMVMMSPRGPSARLLAKGLTLAEFASRLGQQLRHPVFDKTGLTGRYDFTLEYTPDLSGMQLPPKPPGPDEAAPSAAAPADGASEPGSNINSALEKQLGLKLTEAKASLDVIVVDHAEKVPTEN